ATYLSLTKWNYNCFDWEHGLARISEVARGGHKSTETEMCVFFCWR
ncbi:hypothetical protein CEXT_801021, partial [Caerostris extrusa]